jgi:hypothetical protein
LNDGIEVLALMVQLAYSENHALLRSVGIGQQGATEEMM